MRFPLRRATALALPFAVATLFVAPPAPAQELVPTRHPSAGSLLRLLGPHAGIALSPTRDTSTLEALVRLPPGTTAASLGLEPVAPGIARVRGGAAAILAFEAAHPGIPAQVAPPLHAKLDKVGSWTQASTAHLDPLSRGDGVLVGVADTGLDCAHPDFVDPDTGKTRVAWIIDMSLPPAGIYPDLERKYGVVDSSNSVVRGAVYAAADLDALAAKGQSLPGDEVGHGTHVTSIAAGNGGAPPKHTPYVGIAENAQIVFARITRDATDSIDNGDLVRGVQFLFDRADFMAKPIAVNLSLGSDFGPHDGTMDWEEAIASFVGPDKPGHALVAAAGNSGSIVDTPVHQSVLVSQGTRMRVPIATQGASNGSLEVWVTMRDGASLSVGLDGPDGSWIAPVADGDEQGKNTSTYNAGVINGSTAQNSPIPHGSRGAVVVVSGAWPSGEYAVTLDGSGTADLFAEGTGDVSIGQNAAFEAPVREGTINLPATNPAVIGVGCTVNKAQWISIDHATESQSEPVLDPAGGVALRDPKNPSLPLLRDVADGEICWFSSAGPTVTGAPKPEIAAPGGIVVAALSQQALPGGQTSIFTTTCPSKNGQAGGDRCLQVDQFHGVSQGTSMASPMVAGAIALLFERNPMLTQDQALGLLQAGVHPFRGAAPFDDQAGPGELDVMGSLDAIEQTFDPTVLLPDASSSWITLSASYAAADGSTPLTAILELRTAGQAGSTQHRADLFDPTRLRPVVKIDGVEQPPPVMHRRGPGVWYFEFTPPAGLGGSALTLGATFDGAPVVTPKTVAIAGDIWRAEYPPQATGSTCAIGHGSGGTSRAAWLIALACACRIARRRRAPTI
jgi:subtilisin family serine protease